MLKLYETSTRSVPFSTVRPGEVFERPHGGVPDKAYRFLCLKHGRAVNLFANDLATVGEGEVVNVIGRLG